jgi:hypothetical protein
MKLSETPEDLKAVRRTYIETRWSQLSDVSNSYGEEAVKYLLVVNTAAMGATLAFFGAMAHLRPLLWPKAVLLVFAFGVAILGMYHALRYHRIDWIFRGWRDGVKSYFANEIEWNELVDADEARTKRFAVLQVAIAYLSLFSFFIGLAIAGINFADVAPQPRSTNDRAQTTIDSAKNAPGTKTGAPARPALDSGQGAGKNGRRP